MVEALTNYLKECRYQPCIYCVLALIALLLGGDSFFEACNRILFSHESPFRFHSTGWRSEMNLEALLFGAGLLLAGIFLLLKHGGLVWRISVMLRAIRRNEMVFSTETVQYIEPTGNRRPFCIVTVSGRRCECPIYLDYTQTAIGQEMTCLTVKGTHFAFRAPSKE